MKWNFYTNLCNVVVVFRRSFDITVVPINCYNRFRHSVNLFVWEIIFTFGLNMHYQLGNYIFMEWKCSYLSQIGIYLFQINLVGNNHNWYCRCPLDLVNMISDRTHLLKTARIRNIVYQNKCLGWGNRESPHGWKLSVFKGTETKTYKIFNYGCL